MCNGVGGSESTIYLTKCFRPRVMNAGDLARRRLLVTSDGSVAISLVPKGCPSSPLALGVSEAHQQDGLERCLYCSAGHRSSCSSMYCKGSLAPLLERNSASMWRAAVRAKN